MTEDYIKYDPDGLFGLSAGTIYKIIRDCEGLSDFLEQIHRAIQLLHQAETGD